MSNSLALGWSDGQGNSAWPQESSGMLMPGRVQGHPAGTQRAASPAERLLSQAVAWWDVEQYRDGDRFLRNRGTGGELLDLRLGSSIVANSNDPLYLAPQDQGYVYLPGVAGNSVSVPHETAFNTTDLDVRVRIGFDDWTPAIRQTVLNKRAAAGARSWVITVEPNGTLVCEWSNDGTNNIAATSSVAPNVNDGQSLWVRATLDVDDGGVYKVFFYTAPDSVAEPTSWTQLGTPVTGGTTTSIFTTTVPIRAGETNASFLASGRFYRAILKDGINGTTVLDIDCDDITSGSTTSWVTALNQTVNVNRSSTGRKSVCVPSRDKGGRPVMLLGTDDYMQVQGRWQNELLNFGQSDSMTVIAVTRAFGTQQWAGNIISRGTIAGTPMQGWQLRYYPSWSPTSIGWRTGDQEIAGSRQGFAEIVNTHNFGQVCVIAGRVGRTGNIYDSFSNGIRSTSFAGSGELPPANSYRTTLPVVVGGNGVAGYYADMEFYAAAVFRRALDRAEIQLITDYYTEKQNTYYLPTKTEQTTYLAGQLGLSTTTDTAVLDVLSDASFYVDASVAKPGERYAKNLGINRDTLNARYGSAQTANTNDPLLLQPESTGYAYLPGVASNYLSVPDENALDITGDIDICVQVALDDWTPSTTQTLLGKWNSSGNQLSYILSCYPSGVLELAWSPNGTNVLAQTSSVAPTIQDGSVLWVRATLDVDNGAGTPQYEVKFFTSNDGATWTQLGTTRTGTTGVTSIFASTAEVRVGARSDGGSVATGRFYRAQILNGINGTTVLDVDCGAITSGSQTSFTAKTGQVVAINRATSGRKAVAMPSSAKGGRPSFLLGTDDYFEVESPLQHDWLNFNQWESFTAFMVAQRWGTQASHSYMSKASSVSVANTGWSVLAADVNRLLGYLGDASNLIAVFSSNFMTGVKSVIAFVRARGTGRSTTVNGIMASSASDVTSSLSNTLNTRIGAMASGSLFYAEMELQAAAIFRRALTSAEMAVLDGYFGEKYAISQGPDADRKALLSGALGVASNDPVLDVLKDAVFHVDAKAYTDGSQYVRNLGWGGDLLNPQLGSGASADTNDPLYLAPSSKGYVRLPGVVANYLAVADETALRITGDIDLRIKFQNWVASASTSAFLSKYSSSDGQTANAYMLRLTNGTNLSISWRDQAGGFQTASSTTAVPTTAAWIEFRATLQVSTGQMRAYYRQSPSGSWTELGAPAAVGATSINAGNLPLTIGQTTQGSIWPLDAAVEGFSIRDGIDGTPVLDVDCDVITSGSATSFTASTGQTVTINRSTFGRKSVAVPSISKGGSPVWLFGADDYVVVPGSAQNTLLDFGANESLSAFAVYRIHDPSQTSHQSPVISKRGTSGWSVSDSIGPPEIPGVVVSVSGVTTYATRPGGSYRATGGLNVAGIVRDTAAGSLTVYNRGRTPVAVTDATANLSLATATPFAIGMTSGYGTVNSFAAEVYAAIVFRRALTASEITTLTNYFNGRIA